MIRYTVLWRKEVQDDLTQLWLNSADRQQITAAADFIDAELLIDAHVKGSMLRQGARLLLCPPLAARY